MIESDRFLWFAPNSGLWPSFRMEHRLANALAAAGRTVTMIRCGGVLSSYCPVMSAERLHVTSPVGAKKEVCRDCRANARAADRLAGYGAVRLEGYLTDEMQGEAVQLADAVTPHTWRDWEFQGMPLGRWASYTAMLHHKLPDVTASEAAWSEYVSDLRNAVMVALAMPSILQEFQPSHAVVYNPLYPTHRVFSELAVRHGAQLVGLHAGGFIPDRYETVGIYAHVSSSQTMADSQAIRRSLSIPSSPSEVGAVSRHVRELVAGNDPWVYSHAPSRMSAGAIRETLGVRQESPVVVALLSSPDETRATTMVDAEYLRDPVRGYSTAQEFIEAVKLLACERPDIDVVLRLHPRLVANKRESVDSPDLARLLDELSSLPPNAHINAPGDGVGLYDLIGVASAVINHTSSAGLEFLVLGVPVVVFDPVRHNIFPADFGPRVDRDEPERLPVAVDEALATGWSLENSRKAFRWYTAMFLRGMLLISDIASKPVAESGDESPVPDLKASEGSAARRLIPVSVRAAVSRRLQRRQRLATLEGPSADVSWSTELLERIERLDGSVTVWDPVIRIRGDSDPESEILAIRQEVSDLFDLLGFTDGPGVGVVRAGLHSTKT